MRTVDEVFEKLKGNPNLTKEVKENIRVLIIIFNKYFPDIDLTNLYNRIGSLDVKAGNKYIVKEIATYNINNNIIYMNIDELLEGYDAQNVFMHQLLNIITCKDTMTGKVKSSEYLAINHGCAAILAENLVGNDADNSLYIDELITVKLLMHILEPDVLKGFYFYHNEELLMNNINILLRDSKKSKYFIDLCNYNMNSRNIPNNNKSFLDEIQKMIIDMFFNKENVTKEEIIDFVANLIGDNKFFGNAAYKYNVDTIYDYYNEKSLEKMSLENSFQNKERTM